MALIISSTHIVAPIIAADCGKMLMDLDIAAMNVFYLKERSTQGNVNFSTLVPFFLTEPGVSLIGRPTVALVCHISLVQEHLEYAAEHAF